jgi:5'-nucleotidase
MARLLITNDDGIDAPALVPLARAMERFGEVAVVVPNRERSWIGKAITRVGPINVSRVDRGGIGMWAVEGFPADCVQIGSFGVLAQPPDLVLSGINIGANRGSAFATGSGTIGAAVEASNVGIGGIAFSALSSGIWAEWVEWSLSPAATPMWERLAAIAADIVATILRIGFPAGVDALSVNLPDSADLTTRRVVADLARTTYGRLFTGSGDSYEHAFDGVLRVQGDNAGTDMEVLDAGHVAITPIRMATTAPLNGDVRAALEMAGS